MQSHHDRYDYSPIVSRPDYDWPEGKRLAFYIGLNIEHFVFGKGLGHTPTAAGRPTDQRHHSWREYGLRVGVWRIFDLLDELKLPACHLVNSMVCDNYPQIIERIGEDRTRVIGLLETLAGVFGSGHEVGAADVAPYLGDAGGVTPWE
ncbi:MAG: hypothetical protein QF830_04810, partial [Rhodospirillales bacterium]|nr:hypothetical protein [Rhodospirillales bacterium]